MCSREGDIARSGSASARQLVDLAMRLELLAAEVSAVMLAVALVIALTLALVLAVVLAVVPVLGPRARCSCPRVDKGVGLKKEGENLAGSFHNMAPSAEPWGARRDRPSGRARGRERSSPPSVGGISF